METDTPDMIRLEDAQAMVEAALREAVKVADDRGEAWKRCFEETGDALAAARNAEAVIIGTAILALIPNGGGALERALAAERERCAKVAETRWKVWHMKEGNCGVECDATACEEITAAIRAQGETP